MRVQPWQATILSVVLTAFCCRAADAQEFSDSGGATTTSYESIPDSEIGNSLYARDYVGQEADPYTQQAGFMQPGFPSGMSPWPGTGLYNDQFEQVFQEDGLWHRFVSNEGKKYFFSMEALLARTSRLGNIRIGAMNVPTIEDDPRGIAAMTPDGQTGFFPTPSTSLFTRNSQYGLRGRWGFNNPDGSGLEIVGWYLPEDTIYRQLNDEVQGTIDNLNALEPLATIPVDDRNGGTFLFFDNTFRVEQTTTSFGASANVLTTPFFKRGAFVLRPSFGLRYMHIQQKFALFAQTSGVGGLVFNFVNGVFDGTVTGPGTQVFAPLTTTLDSTTKSEMAGPEAGLVAEVGGDFFRVTSKSLISVLANHETIKLNGDNFADGFAAGLPIPFTPQNPNPHAFSVQNDTNHVSPVFEQSISAEMRCLQFVPIINRSRFFSEAMFRAGYTIIIAGEIANPAASVVYRGADPTFATTNRHPEIAPKRRNWNSQMWTLGVTWEY